MLSLETRVNGVLIGCAYIHNESVQDDKGNCLYNVEYHRFDRKPSVIRFNLTHKREEGAEKLILKIYEEITKRLKKGANSKK